MRVGIFILSSAAIIVGSSAIAADLPKEGTFKGTYGSSGEIKVIVVGKERALMSWHDERGQSVGEGFLDHMSWLCWGGADFVKGTGQLQGKCVATDQNGDQIVDDLSSETYSPTDKSFKVFDKFTSGTGKYEGISGGGVSVIDLTFRPPADGTFVTSC